MMRNQCLLLRIHKTLAVVAFVLAVVAVGILLLSPKYFRHAEPDVEVTVIGVPGDKGDRGAKGAKGDKGDTGSNFWGKSK